MRESRSSKTQRVVGSWPDSVTLGREEEEGERREEGGGGRREKGGGRRREEEGGGGRREKGGGRRREEEEGERREEEEGRRNGEKGGGKWWSLLIVYPYTTNRFHVYLSKRVISEFSCLEATSMSPLAAIATICLLSGNRR